MPESVVHFQIRMPPALHERLASVATERKQSLNLMIVDMLQRALDEHAAREAADGPAPTGPGR
ncbi:MAG TPA: toxin-antitoxin system HicB family antitoxin [Isosphaeraceae bacterium]|nr:toxin-antitoxin system HicB family antitoxin [Isosphaeraceae bacterium]